MDREARKRMNEAMAAVTRAWDAMMEDLARGPTLADCIRPKEKAMKNEKVRPLRDFILVQPEPLPEREGLIHLPKTAKNKRCRGTVLAVGPGRVTDHGVRIEPGVRVGERVIYSLHNMAQGVGLDVGGDEGGPLLMPEMDIEAVIDP